MKNIILTLLVATLMISCESRKGNTEANEVTAQSVYQEAMRIHDEVMPRMDEMYQMEGRLKTLKDSLLSDSVVNAQKISFVREKLSALETANKAMMDWMHHVRDVPGATAPTGHEHHSSGHSDDGTLKETPEELLKIQQDQKQRIEEVRGAMVKSIEEARKLLTN